MNKKTKQTAVQRYGLAQTLKPNGSAPLTSANCYISDGKIRVYLIDKELNSFVDEVCFLEEYLNRPDVVCATINQLVKRNDGIKSSQKIRMAPGNLQAPDSIVEWKRGHKSQKIMQ